ncbi:hypothetical protein K458DRAFT_476332 [Lentithecium fluviatile CBS 122367]|uniref:Uncharacterized protein n=1 Tax=Lentithecium fluviatile CBS 122367 TaxID=1168545 RepID=A0A6G1JAH0_9PLEO|nr:hypothetical protein K458DRAFT_476332 [Lentithecium fluviatile CBS 122367]
MPHSILLPQFLLPLSAVGIGRFVLSFDQPHQDFHEPHCTTSPNIIETVQLQYDSIHQSVKHQDIASQLTSFLSSSFSKRLRESIRITANQAKTYYLNNAGEWFREAVKSQETQEWIKRTIDEGEDIYVVVAYHTLMNARITTQLGGQSAAGGAFAVPVSTALTASGVVIPFGNIVDPRLGRFRGCIEDEQRQFAAPGEHIYAVQYRKERYNRPRYLQGKPKDIIKVDLVDEITLEGEHNKCAIESRDILVSMV